MTSRPSTAAPLLAVLAVVLATLGAYVGGYLWLGTEWEYPFANALVLERAFPHKWMRTIDQPAGMVEGLLRGVDVEITWEGVDDEAPWDNDFELRPSRV